MTDPTKSKYRYLTFTGDSNYRRYVQKEDKNLKQHEFTPQEHELPAHGSYGALLFDPRWKARRLEILVRDKHSCVVCNGKENLHVHHRQYHFVVREKRFMAPWEYSDHLLITLCEPCHKKGHGKYKVPTINV